MISVINACWSLQESLRGVGRVWVGDLNLGQEGGLTRSLLEVTPVVKPCLAKKVTALLSAYVKKKSSLSLSLANCCTSTIIVEVSR